MGDLHARVTWVEIPRDPEPWQQQCDRHSQTCTAQVDVSWLGLAISALACLVRTRFDGGWRGETLPSDIVTYISPALVDVGPARTLRAQCFHCLSDFIAALNELAMVVCEAGARNSGEAEHKGRRKEQPEEFHVDVQLRMQIGSERRCAIDHALKLREARVVERQAQEPPAHQSGTQREGYLPRHEGGKELWVGGGDPGIHRGQKGRTAPISMIICK